MIGCAFKKVDNAKDFLTYITINHSKMTTGHVINSKQWAPGTNFNPIAHVICKLTSSNLYSNLDMLYSLRKGTPTGFDKAPQTTSFETK